MSRAKNSESEVAQLKHSNFLLQQNQEMYRIALSLTNHTVIVFDIPTETFSSIKNENACDEPIVCVQNTPESLLDSGIIHQDDHDKFRQLLGDIYSGTPSGECTLRITKLKHEVIWITLLYKTTFDEQGQPSKAIVVLDDITTRKNAEAEEELLRHAAERDALCGLYNRKTFERRMTSMLFNDRRVQCGCLLMVDLDDFKEYNDLYGHIIGDEILLGVTEALKRCFRKDDLLGRFGGDEFMAFAPNITQETALERIGKIEACLHDLSCMKELERPVTLSVGIAEVSELDDFGLLYRKADEALYKAKSKGKGCSVVWSAA